MTRPAEVEVPAGNGWTSYVSPRHSVIVPIPVSRERRRHTQPSHVFLFVSIRPIESTTRSNLPPSLPEPLLLTTPRPRRPQPSPSPKSSSQSPNTSRRPSRTPACAPPEASPSPKSSSTPRAERSAWRNCCSIRTGLVVVGREWRLRWRTIRENSAWRGLVWFLMRCLLGSIMSCMGLSAGRGGEKEGSREMLEEASAGRCWGSFKASMSVVLIFAAGQSHPLHCFQMVHVQ